MPKKEDTTSASVAQGAPMAFSQKDRNRRRKALSAEMVFMGVQAHAILDNKTFDRLAVTWEAIRGRIAAWESRINEQVAKVYPGAGKMEWDGEIRSVDKALVVDFKSPKHEKCITPWQLRAEIEFLPSTETFEATFSMVNGHGKSVLEHEADVDFRAMECGPALPVSNFLGHDPVSGGFVNKQTNPNSSHDPSMVGDVSTGRALQIMKGTSIPSMVGM